MPEVGEMFVVLDDEKNARLIAEEQEYKLRAETIREQQKSGSTVLVAQAAQKAVAPSAKIRIDVITLRAPHEVARPVRCNVAGRCPAHRQSAF